MPGGLAGKAEEAGTAPVTVYADLHVHLGWAGEPGGGVKIPAARNLTLANILAECRDRKGIGMVGVIDAAASGALADLRRLMAGGQVEELAGGGLSYLGEVTLIPGAEVEVLHAGRPVHLLCFVRGAQELAEFAAWQHARVRNASLSTQRLHGPTAADVVAFVGGLGGIVIPAHIFTPHKAALAAAPRIGELIPAELWRHVPAVELGLSSDTVMADQLPELSRFSFVTNSDAHSLAKIAREYNELAVCAPTFDELVLAIRGERGRRIRANYGLDPRLGKYHRTFCLDCDHRVEGDPPVLTCPVNPDHRLVLGVIDRIRHYQTFQGDDQRQPRRRPPYVHQVPLQFVPGLGSKGLERLIQAFGSEMAVLHQAGPAELAAVVGGRLADLVIGAREGRLAVEAGAGGNYGRIVTD